MDFHINTLACKVNSLKFQQLSLQEWTFTARQRINENFAPGPHDPLPGETGGTSVHGPSHLASHMRDADQNCNLTVRQHFAPRNLSNNMVNLLEKGALIKFMLRDPTLYLPGLMGDIFQAWTPVLRLLSR